MDERMVKFLRALRHARWTNVPPVWFAELRHAMNEGWVTVGWGGVLELTESAKTLLSR